MALVTVQRSPSIGNSPQSSLSPPPAGPPSPPHTTSSPSVCRWLPAMLYVLPPPPAPVWAGHLWIAKTQQHPAASNNNHQSASSSPNHKDSGAGGSLDEEETTKNGRSLSECYFAGKGAAVVLPPHERLPPSPHSPAPPASSDIQSHLQSMFYLLRPEETLKMAVKLESVHPGRTRYLVVVSRLGRQETEESCLLGIDCNHSTTVGLVLRVLADTAITLDGDGGFSVSSYGKHHIFKPVSVQAMWSALQTLHKVSSKAREHHYFLSGLTHEWVSHYESCVGSDQSCLNEWHAMDSLESRRPPSPDSVRHKPTEREETERVIRAALKEIMMTVDLDDVTSKQVRSRLEESLDVDLGEFKSFIDEEMIVILGQMDEATEIFPHVYLGSEWNASNLEELNKNGVCHILNVTREIDNFFPGMFDYLNIRVYDDEKTDLLKHWDNTYKYISKAKKDGSKVLVHCKMGISRSASVVIAYAMKAYSWDLKKALTYVQNKRQCIKPNTSFIAQLETYQGILDAMKNREKLQRSKSETNLKSKEAVIRAEKRASSEREGEGEGGRSVSEGESEDRLPPLHGVSRPKSWSPDYVTANSIFTARSQENGDESRVDKCEDMSVDPPPAPPPPPPLPPFPPIPPARTYNINVRLPCNGLTYSVSQNKILHLPCSQSKERGVSRVKKRVSALESVSGCVPRDRRGLVLNLTSHFEEERARKDLFSTQLDTVFAKEETTKNPELPTTTHTSGSVVSRQSSWSSFDSGTVGGEGVSRQSSWGSGDTRQQQQQQVSDTRQVTTTDQRPPSLRPPGKVKELKAEFEAKSGGGGGGSESLPSSPTSDQCDRPSPSPSLEELSVRQLVVRYEAPTPRLPPPPVRTVVPRVVVTSVLAKAAHKKQQQGKTHPLARLTRHTNPVYNTM